MARGWILLLFCCCIGSGQLSAQLVINELSSRGGINSFSGESSDWIELYNAGSEVVMLEDYSLTDDPSLPDKWRFPYLSIQPYSHMTVLANNEDVSVVSNYVSFATEGDDWKYHIGDTAPPSDWAELDSPAQNWPSAPSGFGYADGDDNTEIPFGSTSVFMRREFNILDLDSLYWLYFYIDYDDGYIAYLNGTEISRSSNMSGHNGDHDDFASTWQEAVMYEGGLPEEIIYDYESLVVEGENVLAIQVHNNVSTSSDFTAIPFLFASVNIATINEESNTDLPDWFFTPTFYLQTNFKLSREGETVQLRDATGNLLDEIAYPTMRTGDSFGRDVDGGTNWCLQLNPSPDSENILGNSVCYTEYAAAPIMSPAPGFYDSPETVSINCPDEDANAHFMTDGSFADENSGISSEIDIENTSVLSAKCYSVSKAPSDNATGTYFIDEPSYSLPIISLASAPENLWDDENGIYVLGDTYESEYPFMGANFWQDWEKDAHIELFDINDNRVMNLDMALEIHGGWSRAEPQKSFRIDTKKSIAGNIEYPLMSRKSGITSYNNFNLRNSGQLAYGNRFQDAFVAQLVSKKTDIDYMTHESSMVYLNGEFWGHYGIREKMDEHYVESNHGVNSNEIDLMSKEENLTGSTLHFEETIDMLLDTPTNIPQFYSIADSRIDLDNYIDYYTTEIHIQNLDWGGLGWIINNTKLWRPQTENGKWRYMLFDVDGALGNFGSNINDNYLSWARNPGSPNLHSRLFDRLLFNDRFQKEFINRYADLVNTIFQPDYYNQVIDEIRGELEPDMPKQVDRWSGPASMALWYSDIADMRAYLAGRVNTSRNHIRNHFGLTAQRSVELNVEPAGAGRIQINSISSNAYPWEGVYFQGVPVTITAIPNPGYTFSNWNDNILVNDLLAQSLTIDLTSNQTFTAKFNGSPEGSAVIISEINYHSNENWDMGDWVELYNDSDQVIDLSNWTMSDSQFYNNFKLPVGTVIAPKNYLVLVSDLEKFQSIHPWVPNVLGDFDFQFNNDGELISIRNHADQAEDDVTYNDIDPWPTKADGGGFTLELFDLSADSSDPSSWTDECFLGSPGKAFNNECLTGIEESEVAYKLEVFPNPAQTEIVLNLPSELEGDFQVSLSDKLGRVHLIGKRHLETGSTLKLPKLPNGVYILNLVSDESMLHQKLVIQY